MVKDLHIHQRHFLKSKDIKKLIEQLKDQLPISDEIIENFISSKDKVEWIKLDENQELYAINGVLTFWYLDSKFIPLLSFLLGHDIPFPRVKVDKGAIPFVSKGADVMRPGVTDIDSGIKAGDIVLVEDPSHGRILSVGEAIYSTEEMQQKNKGKIIKCVHSLIDSIWAFSKDFK